MSPDWSLRENVTHGTPRNPIRALRFTAGPRTGYPDHFHVKRHWHDYIEFLLIRKGDYEVEINLESRTLHKGDLCILNSGELHQITGLQAEAVHDALLFHPQILDFSYRDEWQEQCITPFLEQSLLLKNVLHPQDPGYFDLFSLTAQLTARALAQERGWYVRCKLLLLELFAQLDRFGYFLPAKETRSNADTRKIFRYKALISYMEEHYQEPVTLDTLAKVISCNSQYLCRFFREIAGTSPIQYLILCRIEHACILLTRTARPVTEIALDCGFDNISYFIRQFRKVKGETPGEYRKTHAKKTGV